MITFRDPDNIQLEFFWRAPEDGGVSLVVDPDRHVHRS
jgi:hypothetical protein